MSKNNNTKTKKYKCKDINPLLTDYAAGELLPAEIRRIEAHLLTCRNCREEYMFIRQLERDARQLDEASAAVMASIDWEETAQTISGHIPYKERAARKSRGSWLGFNWSGISFNWKMAVPVMAGIFLLGIGLGYLLFHTGPAAVPALVISNAGIPTKSPLARLENTLTRKEVVRYFDQTQLVLTDLMNQCKPEESFSLPDQVDMRRIRALLSKSRYFKDSLNHPQLLSSKELLKKIEWLLYEILMTNIEPGNSCRKLERLQNYIKQERLLFKMRLVGNELSLSEV